MRHKFILLIIGILFSQASFAENIYPCDASCTSNFVAARQLATSLPDGTTFSLIDVKTWEVGTYVVDHYYRMGEYIERAVKVTTTGKVINAAYYLQNAQATFNSTSLRIPYDLVSDAHSVVISKQKEDQVAQYVASNLTVTQAVGAFGASTLQVFKKLVNVTGYVEVIFPDGSTARFELTGIAQNSDGEYVFEFRLQAGSVKDSDGNNIPTSSAEVTGDRQFSSEQNMNRMTNVLDLYGPRYEVGGCKRAAAITCIQGPGGTLDCTKFTVCM